MLNSHASTLATTSSHHVTPTRRQPTSASSSRLTHIDTVRGLLLVLMAVNHIPSDLRVVTDHPFGFMSAAEGFVFMAGLMAGYVYTRKWLRGNFAALRHACTDRALTIYRWHALVFVLVFAGLVALGFSTGSLPVNTPPVLLEHPGFSLISGLLLIQQPTLFDILPMYCVLLLTTPWLLRVCARTGGYVRLIFSSLTLWAAANIFCPQVPFENGLINTGAFNLAAWQLLYVSGLAFGHRWATRQHSTPTTSNERPSAPDYLLRRPSARALIGLTSMAAFLFSVRHGFIPSGLSESALSAVTNKNNLAPLRLLDTALILYLGYLLISRIPRVFSWQPLAWIGRASLVVFSTHVLAAYTIQGFPETFADTATGRWLGTAFMLAVISIAATTQARLSRRATPSKPAPLFAASGAPTLKTRHPRARRLIVRHEPRPPVPADSFHR
jgi:hypothetical protein